MAYVVGSVINFSVFAWRPTTLLVTNKAFVFSSISMHVFT